MAATRTSTRFPRVAGHPALDLVDTVHWRLDPSRAIDTLLSFDDAVAWCAEAGVLRGSVAELERHGAANPEAATRELATVQALREAIHDAALQGSAPASALIAREYASAVARSSLEADGDGTHWSWQVPTDVTGPRAAIALLAHALLTSNISALRQCGDEACGWLYLDTSPRHNRIWCTAAGCGNRNRVARHQARKTP
jgi:predicted RNA-binding Zn ribbon-like protein